MIVHANLDCEARWAGVTLPAHVLAKIGALASLTAALVEGDADVWAPAAVDPARLVGPLRPRMHVGAPPRADLAWADPAAKAANDRRLALAVAEGAGATLPGSCVVGSLADLDAAAAKAARWVCKAPWTTAGRDRCHGTGEATGETRAHVTRLLSRFGALVFEPWLDRVLDFGVCATVRDGIVTSQAPHGLLVDARGGFIGIDLAPPELTSTERDRVGELVLAAGDALAGVGYAGPFAIDGFVYWDGARRLRPLVEINARHTFGHVARALGGRRLGFTPPPTGATILVAPADRDPTTAWITCG
jgi:hypothetical protein